MSEKQNSEYIHITPKHNNTVNSISNQSNDITQVPVDQASPPNNMTFPMNYTASSAMPVMSPPLPPMPLPQTNNVTYSSTTQTQTQTHVINQTYNPMLSQVPKYPSNVISTSTNTMYPPALSPMNEMVHHPYPPLPPMPITVNLI